MISSPRPEACPDTLLMNEVASRFQSCGHPSLRRLEVSVAVDAVTLQGTLPSFYLKQMAQALAKSVDGVARVVNDTVVHRVSVGM